MHLRHPYLRHLRHRAIFSMAEASAAAASATTPTPTRRGRKRAPCIRLDEAGIQHYDAEVALTHKRARAATTLGVYESYWRGTRTYMNLL